MNQKLLHILATWIACVAPLAVAATEAPEADRVWIERPWEFRYFIAVREPHSFAISAEQGSKVLGDPKAYQSFEAIFPLTATIRIQPEEVLSEGAISALVIDFNEQGIVTSLHRGPKRLTGHLNRIYNITLAAGNNLGDPQFDLGKWYTGRSGEDAAFAPAICDLADIKERYKKGYKPQTTLEGNFGCREWGYYLKSPDHPYIDVTSYQKDGTYIRPFIGWGRFDVPPKPVIGKYENTWVCLHECPDGDQPGVILDIKAWAAKHGWPVPKRPKKAPMFTDKPYKRGEFVD